MKQGPMLFSAALLLPVFSGRATRAGAAPAQQEVSGKVISCKEKKPLAFANIVVTSDLSGTTSDESGEFHLTISSRPNDSITISYVGFKTFKEPVSAILNNATICLEELVLELNEVVVRPKQPDHKQLFGKFRLIRANLYAQESETSVAEFNIFLEDAGNAQSAKNYGYDLSAYSGTIREFYERYHANSVEPKHGRRRGLEKEEGNYAHYPVINIRHEAALAYCQWLTDEYNHQRKKKFRKVRFRLPTINEWQIAALGYSRFQSWNLDENKVEVTKFGDSTTMIGGPGKHITINATEIDYPWHGAYFYRNKPQNNKHCFMGNFKMPQNYTPCMASKVAGDGFSMMGHVADYFPNDIGLYDVVGNVAEMIDQNGKACGGSWNHLPGECTIRSVAAYRGPNSWVGFRVFMEVIEEK